MTVPALTASSERAPTMSDGLTSSATPVNPIASPRMTCPGGRAPRGRSQSASATQNGTIEMSRAPSPEGIRCSAQLTRPLPPAAISRPTTPVVSPVVGSGPRRTLVYRQREEDGTRAEEAPVSHQERRDFRHAPADGEVGRTPDDVDGGEGGHERGRARASARPGASPARRAATCYCKASTWAASCVPPRS